MKVALADLDCETLDLSTEKSPPTILKFRELQDGRGDLDFQAGLTILSGIAIRQVLGTLEFPLSSGRLVTEQPATISNVTCDARIRNGLSGELRATLLDTESMSLELQTVRARAHVRAEEILIKLDGRGGRITAGSLTLMDAHCRVRSLNVRLGVLSVTGLKVAWDSGRPRIEAIKAHAKDVCIERGGLQINIAAIDLPEGLRVHDSVEIDSVLVGAIELSMDELKKQPEEVDPQTPVESEPTTVEGPVLGLDYSIFDTINGDLDVDATLATTLPVLGKRTATHHFRIPVHGGIINYKDFESGLSDLEDAFINMRLRGNKLVIERDIPLIPGFHKPIITWALEPGDLALAKKHLVRLRTLPSYVFAGASDDDEERAKKSSVKLHRLDFDNISVGLSLDETAVLKSGQGSLRAHIDEIQLAGSLHFDPDDDEDVVPTALSAKAKGLGTVAEGLLVRGHLLNARLDIGSLESFRLGFDQLRPTKLDFALKNSSLSRVRFGLDSVS